MGVHSMPPPAEPCSTSSEVSRLWLKWPASKWTVRFSDYIIRWLLWYWWVSRWSWPLDSTSAIPSTAFTPRTCPKMFSIRIVGSIRPTPFERRSENVWAPKCLIREWIIRATCLRPKENAIDIISGSASAFFSRSEPYNHLFKPLYLHANLFGIIPITNNSMWNDRIRVRIILLSRMKNNWVIFFTVSLPHPPFLKQ